MALGVEGDGPNKSLEYLCMRQERVQLLDVMGTFRCLNFHQGLLANKEGKSAFESRKSSCCKQWQLYDKAHATFQGSTAAFGADAIIETNIEEMREMLGRFRKRLRMTDGPNVARRRCTECRK